jgi:hypothetical protein
MAGFRTVFQVLPHKIKIRFSANFFATHTGKMFIGNLAIYEHEIPFIQQFT